jgi:hypothetical protein
MMPVSLMLETKHDGEKEADPTTVARNVGGICALAAVAAHTSKSANREREGPVRMSILCCSSL